MRPVRLAACAALALVLAGQAAAQSLSVYPAKGQSASKQASDRAACDRWAAEQTGYNPAVASPPPQKKGGVAKGALGGGAIGGIAGSLGGEAGGGAAAGAVIGGVVGGVRQRRQNDAAKAQQAQNLANYNRSLAACLTGRGYTVK
jgi:hypothetical protein